MKVDWKAQAENGYPDPNDTEVATWDRMVNDVKRLREERCAR